MRLFSVNENLKVNTTMSTIDSMIARYNELEQISINTDDATTRTRAQEERMNLFLLIEKDKQRQFEKQDMRIATDAEHTAKVDEVLAALAEADNQLCAAPVGSQERSDLMGRVLALRLQLEKLQTFKGGE